jgi:hypothetical protein
LSQADLGLFLAHVSHEPALQAQLRHCSPTEAAQLARSLGYEVGCGDLLRYESRAFAWQLSDREYELIARLQHPRRHWWQMCWPVAPETKPKRSGSNG